MGKISVAGPPPRKRARRKTVSGDEGKGSEVAHPEGDRRRTEVMACAAGTRARPAQCARHFSSLLLSKRASEAEIAHLYLAWSAANDYFAQNWSSSVRMRSLKPIERGLPAESRSRGRSSSPPRRIGSKHLRVQVKQPFQAVDATSISQRYTDTRH